jgi:hypothetical protein
MAKDPIFKIRVAGRVSPEGQDWLGGMQILPGETSLLVGRLPDNSALYGVLSNLASLNMTLISVERLDEGDEAQEEVE